MPDPQGQTKMAIPHQVQKNIKAQKSVCQPHKFLPTHGPNLKKEGGDGRETQESWYSHAKNYITK
jgi:hypothetical protein